MKILVLGAGAIGGYFGGRLAEAGADVTFLVRPKRRDQLGRDGLQVQNTAGELQLALPSVQTVLADQLEPGFDAVLLTCKAYDLDAAMDAIAPAMNDACVVIPLLNGLAHFERLDRRFGAGRVMGGTCMIDATLRSDGLIVRDGALQRLLFGERDGTRSDRAEAFAAACAPTAFRGELVDDIQQRLWDKLVFLSALAATTCLFRANVGEIMASPGGREAVQRTLAVNVQVAAREGYPLGDTAIAFARDRLTDPTGRWSASLLRDLESGGRIEGDHIVGWMLERARQHGLDDTVLSLAYTALKAYEVRRDANRLQPR